MSLCDYKYGVSVGVIGDDCEVDPDCYNAFSNSSCVNQMCACDVGYYNSSDDTHCVARKLMFIYIRLSDLLFIHRYPVCSNIYIWIKHTGCNTGDQTTLR